MSKIKDFLLLLKKHPKKIIIIFLVLIFVFTLVFVVKKYVFKDSPKELYEVAIMVRDQKSSDSKEDARSSLKKGDVLLAKKDGHQWSKTERVSYLILKMNLSEEEVQKLTAPVEKKLSKEEVKSEIEQFKKGRDKIKEEELTRFEEELKQRRDTVVMRKYRINLEKYFPDFKANDLIKGQPFQSEVYDWKIVEKK